MNYEAGNEKIPKLLLGEGKEFKRLDANFQSRFLLAIEYIMDAQNIRDVARFKSLNLKFFDGHFQINIDGDKTMWFEESDGEIVITYFGSTDHKHRRKR